MLTRVSSGGEGTGKLKVAEMLATLFDLVNNVWPWPTEGWEMAVVGVAFVIGSV